MGLNGLGLWNGGSSWNECNFAKNHKGIRNNLQIITVIRLFPIPGVLAKFGICLGLHWFR